MRHYGESKRQAFSWEEVKHFFCCGAMYTRGLREVAYVFFDKRISYTALGAMRYRSFFSH